MNYPKKYKHNKVIGTAYCTNPSGCVFLRLGYNYNIIDTSKYKVLIRFNSGGAQWYLKERFTTRLKTKKMGLKEIEVKKPKQIVISDLKAGTLFKCHVNQSIFMAIKPGAYMAYSLSINNENTHVLAINISTGTIHKYMNKYSDFTLIENGKKFVYKAKTI